MNKALPSAEFSRVLKVASVCASMVGADVANLKYRVNVLTIGVWTCIILYLSFTFYYSCKVAKEDWKNVLLVFTLVPGAIQGAVKLASGIWYTRVLSRLVLTMNMLYVEFEEKGNEYYGVLYKCCNRQRNVVKLFVFLYIVGGFGVIIVPVIMTITTGERYLIMYFLIPGLDVDTNVGYYLTQFVHATFMILGIFGLFAGDIYFLILLTQCSLIVDIFAIKVTKFNELAQDREKYLLKELHDLIKWHQFYTEYCKDVTHIFYYVVTVVIGSSCISILCCMFIIITRGSPEVYPFFLLSIATLYTYCFLGTQIEKCDDEFYELICDIAWYQLRPAMRKTIVQMIYKAQHPRKVMVAGYMPLSVNTALRITNTLYSILMMMLQFVDA